MQDGQGAGAAKRCFLALWLSVCALKLVLAARLPLFVDEAFYWQEGRHPAWAYSDLPGMTAWLARAGDALGDGTLALRLPFIALAALVPWLVARMAAREFGERAGWQAGSLSVLLPLSGTMGLLALPDVAMLLATVLCLDAGLRLLRGVDALAAGELALGLVLGGLSHYRFAAVIGTGLLALLLLREGRRALSHPLAWAAIATGALAWLPLLAWNLQHADAGLRFQLVDRHPWRFGADGLGLGGMQLVLATPLLLAAMAVAAWRGVRDPRPAARLLAASGAMIVLGFLALGFFADRERVSFHWPLPGYVALLPLLPAVLAGWTRGWRVAAWATAAAGLAIVLGYYALASTPGLRAHTASLKAHPTNFAGWVALDAAVRDALATMPADTRLLAGSFKLGAELGFLRDDPRIAVLEHPVNHKHGRAPQLAQWGLLHASRESLGEVPVLLAASANDVDFRDLLAHYHDLCARLGPLPPPRVVSVDHGRQRFLLFALGRERRPGPCTTPALAYIDAPTAGARVGDGFEVAGWAFKDGVGLRAVEILLDGRPVAMARYGESSPGVAAFWRTSTDPNHPRVYFRARVQAAPPGRRWLGLRLHAADGSSEDWPEQLLLVR